MIIKVIICFYYLYLHKTTERKQLSAYSYYTKAHSMFPPCQHEREREMMMMMMMMIYISFSKLFVIRIKMLMSFTFEISFVNDRFHGK